jgi:hypothetical protein
MKYLFIVFALVCLHPIYGQTKLPVIKATSKQVAINDGGYFDKNAWSLSPVFIPEYLTPSFRRFDPPVDKYGIS